MNTIFFDITFYTLGFVGLIACSLIPIRTWFILRASVFTCEKHKKNFLAPKNIALMITIALALFILFQVSLRIFKCLNTEYCGPSIASGWIYLAILGACYIIFEISISIIQKINT